MLYKVSLAAASLFPRAKYEKARRDEEGIAIIVSVVVPHTVAKLANGYNLFHLGY